MKVKYKELKIRMKRHTICMKLREKKDIFRDKKQTILIEYNNELNMSKKKMWQIKESGKKTNIHFIITTLGFERPVLILICPVQIDL